MKKKEGKRKKETNELNVSSDDFNASASDCKIQEKSTKLKKITKQHLKEKNTNLVEKSNTNELKTTSSVSTSRHPASEKISTNSNSKVLAAKNINKKTRSKFIKPLQDIQKKKEKSDQKKKEKSDQKKIVNNHKSLQEILNCTVCFNLPEDEIYQCSHGHLLCKECHRRIICGDVALCPTCRIGLSRLHPSRNVIAESTRDSLSVRCSNVDCNEKLTYQNFKHHLSSVCRYRMMKCKYEKIGCDWENIELRLEDHQKLCTWRTALGEDILARVLLKEVQEKNKEQDNQNRIETCQQITNLISNRCREIIVRDIRLEKDYSGSICSAPFSGLGEEFIVQINKKSKNNKIELIIERIDHYSQRRLPLNVVILRGPSLAVNLVPSIHKCYFTLNSNVSKPLVLPVDEIEGQKLIDCHQIHLRIIFIDLRSGIERQFTSLCENPSTNNDQDDNNGEGNNSMTDSEGDELVRNNMDMLEPISVNVYDYDDSDYSDNQSDTDYYE